MAITVIPDFMSGVGNLLTNLRIGFDGMAGNKPGAGNLLVIQKFNKTLGTDFTKFTPSDKIRRTGFTRSNPD